MYQAGNWSFPKSVVFKIEKSYGQMFHMFTFIVTTMIDLEPYQVLQCYCDRGKMKDLIKEGNFGFDLDSVNFHAMVVNSTPLQEHALAYILFNLFTRLVLLTNMRKQRIDNIRLKLLQIATKVVHLAGYTAFKMDSSCPYKR